MIAKNTIGLCVFSFQTRLKNMYFFEHSNLNNNFENGSSKKHRLLKSISNNIHVMFHISCWSNLILIQFVVSFNNGKCKWAYWQRFRGKFEQFDIASGTSANSQEVGENI